MKIAKKGKSFLRFLPLYIMVLPGTIYLIVNNYIPMAGVILAFKSFDYSKGIWASNFNGFINFENLFKGNQIWLAVKNTLLYNIVFIVFGTVLAIAVAVILSMLNGNKIKNFYQGVFLIPYLISIIIVSYMVFGILSTDKGILNHIIKSFGGNEISWYTTPNAWPFVITFVSLWKGFGYSSIIYYTTILGIDLSIYEAASIDGAGRWKQVLYVTLPGIKTTMITMVILSVGRMFASDFGLFYQVPMDSGPLLSVTQTVDTYIYRALINKNDIGISAASGLIQSVLGFILVVLTNLFVIKMDSESRIF
jgi:putative aldouronate transport system permease protein